MFGGVRRIHFIGIGGAGMSAIAKVLLERGMEVTGSDLKRSRTTTALDAMGARVRIGHDPSSLEGADVVVVSIAIAAANPELTVAKERGLRVVTRGEALAELLTGHRSVVVAGTHGKTTTTSMIVSILRARGWDPTYLVGGGLNDAGTNARAGTQDVAVAESDESDGSFLLLSPHIGVVTNVELDHIDFWGSIEALRDAFGRFMSAVQPHGSLVVPAGDPHLSRAAAATGLRTISFGDGGDVRADEPEPSGPGTSFDLVMPGGHGSVRLGVPGAHNVANALAAATACGELGLPPDEIADGLSAYRGVERRFQVIGTAAGVTIIDDYAHHPTEVSATLAAARPGPWDRVVAVFQPHRYSRTAALFADFGGAFGDADRIVVTDVYGAGEDVVPGVSGKLVADAICAALPGRHVAYIPHRADLAAYLSALCRRGDALMTLGAGDITSLGDELLFRWARDDDGRGRR